MPRPMHLTTALPRQLREELGIKDRYGKKERNRNRPPVSRKAQRKEDRQQKRHHGRGMNMKNKRQESFGSDDDEEEEEGESEDGIEDEGELGSEDERRPASAKLSKSRKTKTAEEEEHSRPQEPKISKSVMDKLAQDDKEIEALEKRLGIKGRKKLPKAFEDEGLADILGDLAEDSEREDNKKRKREESDWLQSKRRKAQGLDLDEDGSEVEGSSASDSDEFDLLEDDAAVGSDEVLESETGESEDLDELEEADEEDDEPLGTPKEKKARENPYVAPVTKPTSTLKYIPPSMRMAASGTSEQDVRLRRQAQGLLNKLSEANLVSILNDVEKLYRENPRQSVTSTLASLLLTLVADRASLQDTFIILHAGFIAGLYKLLGMDFGAVIIQNLVEMFDKSADERGPFNGKEHLNLVSLLSQLYNFHVVGSNLVFDYIRLFLQEITETNTELLLKIIRNSGPQLRQDDPSALKDIVLLIQPAVARIGESSLSVRTKFMIETITDLKNNRMKTGISASTISSEHITKMRKTLGSLNSRNIRATEPIRVSMADIRNSEKKGKWWLVGASWKELDPLEAARQELSASSAVVGNPATKVSVDEDSGGEPDIVSIAKAHRMNTDVRRSIFVAIMSAHDYRDAHVRLLKLHLKKNQEYEIPRVLVHCAMEEEAYNPYYTLIARRLCSEMGRRIKMSFMFTLWDVFKRMGEKNDEEENYDDGDFNGFDDESSDATKLNMKSIVNLSKMYGTLISENLLTLAILKNLNFAYLQPKTSTFVEILIITIIQHSQMQLQSTKKRKTQSTTGKEKQMENEERTEKQALLLSRIFSQTHQNAPHIVKGLLYFIRKVVAKSDILSSSKERKMVKWGCGTATSALKGVEERED